MWRVLSFFFLLFFACSKMFGEYADHRNRHVDSLEIALRHEERLQWVDRVRAHSDLMWGYLQTDGKKFQKHARAVLQLTEGRRDGLLARSAAFRLIGQCAYAECLYDSAKHCYDRALDVIDQMEENENYKQSDIDDALSFLYGTIGNLYNIQGMSTLALDYYLKALKIFEREGAHESVAISYYNIGEMFLEMGNNEEAHRYYLLSRKAAAETDDSLIQALPLTGLGMSLLNMNKPDSAMLAAHSALKYYLNHVDEEFACAMNTYVLLARIAYLGFGDTVHSQRYLDEAYPISERFESDNTDVSDLYCFQAELCSARGDWQGVVTWALRALDKNDEDPHHNIGVYKLLSKAYAHLGNGDESERYIQLMHAALETMSNQQHQSALGEMQVRYETQKKEAELEQIKSRQRLLVIIYFALTVILLVFGALAFAIMRHRKQLQLMKAKLFGEANERQRMARDLHDRLGGMLTATRLSMEGGRVAESLGLLKQTHAEMRKVAHHLMPEALSRSGLDVALSEFCSVLPNATYSCMGTPHRFEEQLEILAYCALHELVNNAIKHANAHNITIQLLFEEEKLSCIVSDDGKGFVPGEEKGMGLSSIRERINVLGGTFLLQSVPNQGTEVYFSLPI